MHKIIPTQTTCHGHPRTIFTRFTIRFVIRQNPDIPRYDIARYWPKGDNKKVQLKFHFAITNNTPWLALTGAQYLASYMYQCRCIIRIPTYVFFSDRYTVRSRYIAVIFFVYLTKDTRFYERGMGCRSWAQIWSKLYNRYYCAVCTIVSYITATYRESIVFGGLFKLAA